jgi:ATPase subunit of ABC transporter with duplicated ATPase domains
MPAFVILDSISLNTPDGRTLFNGLTFAQARERTGIVGRNGCGKSTLLRRPIISISPRSKNWKARYRYSTARWSW